MPSTALRVRDLGEPAAFNAGQCAQRYRTQAFSIHHEYVAPQVGFSETMRKMRSRNSLLTHFLPAFVRCHEIHVQYNLKPPRCHRTTMLGCTRINARRQSTQSRLSITQNSLSDGMSCGCGCFCLKTESCCRRARFSKSRWRRERNNRVNRTARGLRWRAKRSVLHVKGPRLMANLYT